ncbi:hypothetical protein HID58_006779, partial [Brassica napus]
SHNQSSTINFTPSPPVSYAKSFMSSHRCYSKSNQISSGFVITNASSQVSVRGAIFMPTTRFSCWPPSTSNHLHASFESEFNILLEHNHQSCRVIKYHFPGPFILATSDMVEEVYVTAEGSE